MTVVPWYERRAMRGIADQNRVSIAAAGAIRTLVMMLGSPSACVQEAAAGALYIMALNGAWRARGGFEVVG